MSAASTKTQGLTAARKVRLPWTEVRRRLASMGPAHPLKGIEFLRVQFGPFRRVVRTSVEVMSFDASRMHSECTVDARVDLEGFGRVQIVVRAVPDTSLSSLIRVEVVGRSGLASLLKLDLHADVLDIVATHLERNTVAAEAEVHLPMPMLEEVLRLRGLSFDGLRTYAVGAPGFSCASGSNDGPNVKIPLRLVRWLVDAQPETLFLEVSWRLAMTGDAEVVHHIRFEASSPESTRLVAVARTHDAQTDEARNHEALDLTESEAHQWLETIAQVLHAELSSTLRDRFGQETMSAA